MNAGVGVLVQPICCNQIKLPVSREIKALEDEMRSNTLKGWGKSRVKTMVALEREMDGHKAVVDNIKRQILFPDCQLRFGGEGVYVGIRDLWLETISGQVQIIMKRVPGSKVHTHPYNVHFPIACSLPLALANTRKRVRARETVTVAHPKTCTGGQYPAHSGG